MNNIISEWFDYMDIDELVVMMDKSENANNMRIAIEELNGDNPAHAVELIRNAAINGYVPAMYYMAFLCHDDRKGMKTQDRTQEHFWYNKILSYINGNDINYHAQNMIEGSYDKRFPYSLINESLEIAAAKGNQQAVEMLVGFYTKDFDDKIALKKSLYWFYSLENMSTRLKRKLEEVENALGIS